MLKSPGGALLDATDMRCAAVPCRLPTFYRVRREAANAIRFAELFSFMPEVVVPNMYSQFTTPRVLVMQWIEGERLRSASSQAPAAAAAAAAAAAGSMAGGSSSSRLQGQHARQVAEDLRLVEIGVRCSLEQMLEEGFYHAGARCGC
jgi:predicted unusual protein kinase regulating ubiquinone biosynthesis (AarF/ABC1/UbiB family)